MTPERLEQIKSWREQVQYDWHGIAGQLLSHIEELERERDGLKESLLHAEAEATCAAEVVYFKSEFDGEKYIVNMEVKDVPEDYWLWRELESVRNEQEILAIQRAKQGGQS